MESDIILEGFLEAEAKHGLRYMRVIGDGDSSVFAKIRDNIPCWGSDVSKEECSNHVCKCYRSNLEKLVSENLLYKGKHHLTKTTRVRLVSALRCAIRVRSNEYNDKKINKTEAIAKLRSDIKNSVYHVFGHHKNCSDFCRANKNLTPTSSTDSMKDDTIHVSESNPQENIDMKRTNIFLDRRFLYRCARKGTLWNFNQLQQCGTTHIKRCYISFE